MYLLTVAICLCIAYLFFLFIFPIFFKEKGHPIELHIWRSVAIIFVCSLIGYGIALSIPNPDLGNRFLHTFGGGFMAFFTCFLVVKDRRLQINRLQFFIFSFLVVIALGVANEILECILQNSGIIVAATSLNDTWFDLISNTVGALIASVVFVPFITPTAKSNQK